MTYQLPDEPYLGTHEAVNGCQVDIYGYTADQMQAAYQAGRDSMKAECVKVCEDFDIPDRVEGAHPDYVEGKRMAAAQLAHAIKELK